MVNASFASHQGNGAVTWLNNAFRLMQLPLGIFGVAIATVTLPLVSKSAAVGDLTTFRRTLARALRLAFFLTIPSAIGLICLAEPIISLLYQHGRFSIAAANQTAGALQFYAVGLAAYSGIKVLAPAFYALDARKTPMNVSFVAIGINVLLNVIFTYALRWGHRGLAMSTSVTAVVNFTLLYLLMSRRVGPLETRQNVLTLAKLAVAGGVLAATCLLGRWFLLDGFDYFSLPEKNGRSVQRDRGGRTRVLRGELPCADRGNAGSGRHGRAAVPGQGERPVGRPGLPFPGGLRRVSDVFPPLPSIYADPAFDMACEQFRLIADYLNIDANDRDRLLLPKRAVMVALPIHRDDGSTSVYTGYRVQHHLTIGPTKGGTRFAPSVNMGEVAALSIWMSWKCALAGLPYGGAKGRHHRRPAQTFPTASWKPSAAGTCRK